MKPDQISPVTLSLGVAELKKEETLQLLIERADAALYEAKRTGRNKVVWAE
ncbi:MAG: Diguanylate cyclase DgcZ [Candidatus Erwinia impunctatus]|nr:Diguanylate cyclase DgcZ [Culicoides impunctatus]